MTLIPITSEIDLTPKLMAEAFWNMGSDKQAEFFHELNTVIVTSHAKDPKSWAWSLGEMQWCYVAALLEKDKAGRDMLMAMAAPLYLHTLRSIETAN